MNIIPSPQKIDIKEGNFLLGKNSSLVLSMVLPDERLEVALKKTFECANVTIETSEEGYALWINEKSEIPASAKNEIKGKFDSYCLKLEKSTGFVFSYTARGLFYGLKTLGQIIKNHDSIPLCEIIDWSNIQERVMYYDLRQTYPKYELLLKYIEEMADFKANALIIEYEDKFPFEKHTFLRNKKYCFTQEQFDLILKTAEDNFVEVIPLQQSFGHLEYVLKHDMFKHLRETPSDLGEMCPCNEESFEVAKMLIKEMADKHPNARYIHLGCDEVWSLGKCDSCKARGVSRERLFIEFVNKIVDYACSLGKIPLIWHDMLSKCSEEDVKIMDKRAIIVMWLYDGYLIEREVEKLTKLFGKYSIKAVGGSAVRCYDAIIGQNMPPLNNRLANIDQWVKAAKDQNISMIVSTNWAANFALGSPYGIFETTHYAQYYSCEKYWNWDSDKSTFLDRFLRVYHGVDADTVRYELHNAKAENYYDVLPLVLDKVKEHKDIAEHLCIAREFDAAVCEMNVANANLYRYEMFRDSEGDMTSLLVRTKRGVTGFEAVREKFKNSLERFLPEEMARMHMRARYCATDFLFENLYKDLFAELENNK